jgi:hypothetical protein
MRALAALAALALAGCIDYRQEVVVYPDGSGRIVRRLAVKRDVLNLVRALSKNKVAATDPLDDFADLGRLRESSRGIAAWGAPERSSQGGWDAVSMTAYFDDVDQVRLFLVQPTDGVLERRLEFAARVAKTPAGGVLEVDPTSRDTLNPDDPAFRTILPFLKEARMAFSVRVPGKIDRAEGYADVDGRTASLVFDQARLLPAIKEPKGAASLELDRLLDERPRISWTAAPVPADELAEFRKAFAEARAAQSR